MSSPSDVMAPGTGLWLSLSPLFATALLNYSLLKIKRSESRILSNSWVQDLLRSQGNLCLTSLEVVNTGDGSLFFPFFFFFWDMIATPWSIVNSCCVHWESLDQCGSQTNCPWWIRRFRNLSSILSRKKQMFKTWYWNILIKKKKKN